MASDDPIRELGRSVAQIHLKIARLHESVEAQGEDARRSAAASSAALRSAGAGANQSANAGSRSDADATDALLDLLDAVDAALARRDAEPPARWRLFGRKTQASEDLWLGVAVAAEEARERLRRSGIEAAPEDGAFDPLIHHAVEIVPVEPGGDKGTIAVTHRRGWLQRKGDRITVLRTAQVGVHGDQE